MNMQENYKMVESFLKEKNIEYYIEYYVSGMVSLLIHWFVYGSRLSVDEFSKLVIEITGLESVKILKFIYGKD